MSDDEAENVAPEENAGESDEDVVESKSGKRKKDSDGGETKVSAGDGDADAKILAYMLQANRPYSHLQVFENMHRTIKKAEVPRALDRLTDQGRLTMKLFKKVKIYLVNQDSFVPLPPEELARLDAQIAELSERQKADNASVGKLQQEVGALSSQLSDADIAANIAQLQEQIEAKRAKLGTMKGNAGVVSTAEVAKRQQKFNTYFLEWRKRKRAVKEMVDTYMENAPKSMTPKKFLADNGLETDEEAKVDITRWEKLLKR